MAFWIAMHTDLQDAKQTSTKFRKGKSGNAAGRLDGKRYREAFAALASEFGGDDKLTASQRVLIDTIAKLQSRRVQRDHVRVANTIAKLMRLLGIDPKREPTKPGNSTLGAILRGDHG
jgi:hypothetical protein